MRKRLGAAACVFAVMAIAAPAASAATEFGDACVGDEAAPGDYTVVGLSSGGTLPLTAPADGVVTKVKVSYPPFPFAVPTTVKGLHPTGGDNYLVTGQASFPAAGGQTVADARIPVQTGDRLGLHGSATTYEGSDIPPLTFYCDKQEDSSLGATAGDPAPGAIAAFAPVDKARAPVIGVIEPDADKDGYGDETQDKCPQSAAAQSSCPPIVVDIVPLPGKGAVTIFVASDIAAPVSVAGTVAVPGGSKKGKARSSSQIKLKPVSHEVKPGVLAKFKLKFPAKLKAALGELESGKSLKLKVTATATNVAGAISTDSAKLKLKGA